MANWQDIKNDIQSLKEEVVKVYEAIDKWRAKVAECMAQEHIDPAELQAVHDDMSSVVSGLEEKLHADGM